MPISTCVYFVIPRLVTRFEIYTASPIVTFPTDSVHNSRTFAQVRVPAAAVKRSPSQHLIATGMINVPMGLHEKRLALQPESRIENFDARPFGETGIPFQGGGD